MQRLVALGVEREVAAQVTTPVDALLKWEPIRTESRRDYAILFLPCAHFDFAYVYLLINEGKDWRVVDHVDLDCHYDNSVFVEAAPIRKPNAEELIVHHAGEGHGTGYWQQNFKVFAVAEGRLKPLLDTEEVASVNRTDGSYDLLQRSTFVVVPDAKSQSRVIEETRSAVLNGGLKVQRRYFRWDVHTGRYKPSKFISVEAKAN